MNAQHRSQLLVEAVQAICLETNNVKLPKADRIAAQHQQYDDYKA